MRFVVCIIIGLLIGTGGSYLFWSGQLRTANGRATVAEQQLTDSIERQRSANRQFVKTAGAILESNVRTVSDAKALIREIREAVETMSVRWSTSDVGSGNNSS